MRKLQSVSVILVAGLLLSAGGALAVGPDPAGEAAAPAGKGEAVFSVVMLVAGHTYKDVFIPRDVLAKSVPSWQGVPLNFNHESEDVFMEIGYVKNVRMEGAKLVGDIHVNKEHPLAKYALAYIRQRIAAGQTPEVSVGMMVSESAGGGWGDTEAGRIVGDHLALVTRGACGPAGSHLPGQVPAGCGVKGRA